MVIAGVEPSSQQFFSFVGTLIVLHLPKVDDLIHGSENDGKERWSIKYRWESNIGSR